MNKPLDFKKMFPNRNLQPEEKGWVVYFSGMAFNPINTENVRTEADFLKMISENEAHCLECAQDAVDGSKRMKEKLAYYVNDLNEKRPTGLFQSDAVP